MGVGNKMVEVIINLEKVKKALGNAVKILQEIMQRIRDIIIELYDMFHSIYQYQHNHNLHNHYLHNQHNLHNQHICAERLQ